MPNNLSCSWGGKNSRITKQNNCLSFAEQSPTPFFFLYQMLTCQKIHWGRCASQDSLFHPSSLREFWKTEIFPTQATSHTYPGSVWTAGRTMNKKIKSSYLSFITCSSSFILPILFVHEVADSAYLVRSWNK